MGVIGPLQGMFFFAFLWCLTMYLLCERIEEVKRLKITSNNNQIK